MLTTTRYSTDRHDKLARLIGVCVDSTFRVAKVGLRESEIRFHSIFNGTFQFIQLLIKEGIVLEVNQTALNFSGLQPQHVVELSDWEIWWTRLESLQSLQYLLSSGPTVIYTCKSSGNFRSRFISENIVTFTAYKARETLEYSGFWSSHLHSVLQSFERSSNVKRILGTGLRMAIIKKCLDMY
ncbi:PAS domain-containing protein [Nostoc sp.]|uniref:PAS domain-containing protein n=1 Tax=Nostoc sp. TaxID=1180 RepID=UPI002FF9272A